MTINDWINNCQPPSHNTIVLIYLLLGVHHPYPTVVLYMATSNSVHGSIVTNPHQARYLFAMVTRKIVQNQRANPYMDDHSLSNWLVTTLNGLPLINSWTNHGYVHHQPWHHPSSTRDTVTALQGVVPVWIITQCQAKAQWTGTLRGGLRRAGLVAPAVDKLMVNWWWVDGWLIVD